MRVELTCVDAKPRDGSVLVDLGQVAWIDQRVVEVSLANGVSVGQAGGRE